MKNIKKCTKCGRELPLDCFSKNSKTGYGYWCKDCARVYNVEWRKANPEKERAHTARWRKNNPVRRAQWHKDNPGYFAEYDRKRRAIDPEFRLIKNMRSAMTAAVSGRVKSLHTEELIGCSMEYLRQHLEGQFTEGMAWDNYGKSGWHIDHIIPLSYFDLSDPEQQKRAWHYTNLQPLWAVDNLKKNNKIEERQLVLL